MAVSSGSVYRFDRIPSLSGSPFGSQLAVLLPSFHLFLNLPVSVPLFFGVSLLMGQLNRLILLLVPTDSLSSFVLRNPLPSVHTCVRNLLYKCVVSSFSLFL